MKLTEYKTKYEHYFFDEDNDDEIHGLGQSWYGNDQVEFQIQFNHGKFHGELKFFYEDGSLKCHEWHEHDEQVLDFLKGDKYPTSKEELLIFKLTHQGEFLPK